MIPVADLHCDLLYYLATGEGRTPYDEKSSSSFIHFREGNVHYQTLAAFTKTDPGSAAFGKKQRELYASLIGTCPTQFFLSIENASGLLEEDEPLDLLEFRLGECITSCGAPLYISLTWNSENRFGGGNATSIGLKQDGKHLLNLLNTSGIAVDLSHTSDALAFGILNYIDQNNLNIKVIASHSNFRKILDHPRNLPDELVKEIIHRKGLIGLNFVRGFMGNDPKDFIRHISYVFELGAQHTLALGADFFPDSDISDELAYLKPFFLEGYNNPSCYPKLVKILHEAFSVDEIKKIFHGNFLSFLEGTRQVK